MHSRLDYGPAYGQNTELAAVHICGLIMIRATGWGMRWLVTGWLHAGRLRDLADDVSHQLELLSAAQGTVSGQKAAEIDHSPLPPALPRGVPSLGPSAMSWSAWRDRAARPCLRMAWPRYTRERQRAASPPYAICCPLPALRAGERLCLALTPLPRHPGIRAGSVVLSCFVVALSGRACVPRARGE